MIPNIRPHLQQMQQHWKMQQRYGGGDGGRRGGSRRGPAIVWHSGQHQRASS